MKLYITVENLKERCLNVEAKNLQIRDFSVHAQNIINTILNSGCGHVFFTDVNGIHFPITK